MLLGNYKDLLNGFKEKKYEFISFDDFKPSFSNQLILRHDIDFDCGLALEMARIEFKENVKSTYFFLLSNNLYNPFSSENLKLIDEIKNLGHDISLHFDASIYKNVLEGLQKEIKLFNYFFNVKIKIISLHRPSTIGFLSKEILNGIKDISPNIYTTYSDSFFKKTKYFADSTGEFTEGHPLESIEFKQTKNIQLLIHPIWWIGEGNNKYERIEWFKKLKEIKSHSDLKKSLKFYGK
tara:strand:+ start:217 stop:927 length:711 start_codon:yes stop_codon:yes gene_type:complete